MSYSESEAEAMVFEALAHSSLDEEWLKRFLPSYERGWRPFEYLYVPDNDLVTRIEQYTQWCQSQEGEDPGHLMEEIAMLAFRCLKGWISIKSYQSFAQQHDLVISGNDSDWESLIANLRLPWEQRTIVVEAKNLSSKVGDKQFARLCGILQSKFEQTSALGVFFTRLGATGFPMSRDSEQTMPRQRVLRDSQATQVIFHAKTKKYVIVLDDQDIKMLTEQGALPRILEAKIREVEECTGVPIEFGEDWTEIDLPPHLSKHIRGHKTPA